MKPKSWGVWSFLVSMVVVMFMAASASAQDKPFVVSASINGDANYMVSNGDGTFSQQQILQLTSSSGISLPFKFGYGNGLGDFDDDGDLDYIMGLGYKTGDIYLFENKGSDYQFTGPVLAATWEGEDGETCYPGGMAVADFDEDGHTDFVMVLVKSTVTLLYLGDGALGFKPSILYSSAPSVSYGTDAADFNNDGHADFIVAPGKPDQFYINLGRGNGTFDTYTFNTEDGGAVYGVAAADFTGDGIADIAAADEDILYIYKGTGDGKTFEFLNSYAFELNLSALDNIDVNGDGFQDLVAADYGSQSASIAVLLGNGDGTFSLGDIYLGGTSSARKTVTGPPYESNREPVAVIKIKVDDQEVGNPLEVMAAKEVEFDGASSSDDGQIKSYLWDFGDGTTSTDVTFFHTYYEAGDYIVNLKVTDDKKAEASVQIKLTVAPMPVTVKFSPNPLDLKSRDKWVLATIKVPDGIDAARVVRDSITLGIGASDPIAASPDYRHTFMAKLWRKIRHRMHVVVVKFNRQAVIKAIGGPNDNAVLTIAGKVSLNGGRADFAGSGTIKTYEKPKRWGWGFLNSYFRKPDSKNVACSAKRK